MADNRFLDGGVYRAGSILPPTTNAPRSHQAHTTLENAVALRDDRRVIVRHWLVLVSFFFTLVAYAGIAACVVARAPALALLGFCFHTIFVITELLRRSVELFALRPV